MDIIELGAIGELVGGVAVIASLIYVGLQVQQSNRVARAASIREVAAEMSHLFLRTCDPDLSGLVRRGIDNFDGLSKIDQCVVSGFLGAIFTTAQTTFAVRTSSTRSQLERICASCIASDGLVPWWSVYKLTLNPRFVETVEELRSSATPLERVWPWFALDEAEPGDA